MKISQKILISAFILCLVGLTIYAAIPRQASEYEEKVTEKTYQIQSEYLGKKIRFVHYAGSNEDSNLCFAYLDGQFPSSLVYVPCERIPARDVQERLLWVNGAGFTTKHMNDRVFNARGHLVQVNAAK